MKKLFMYLAVISITFNSYAQSPQKLSYQAVIRDVNGTLVQSHAVGIRIQILQTSEFGAAVYVETHSTSTNANGLLTLEIGGGTIVTGTFSGIDWSAGPYFIKTETDPTGGTSYTITGTSQILSVPYALHSKSSGNGFASVYSVTDFRPVLYANGNIGIGTANNGAKLNVNGRTVIGSGQDTWGSQISIDASLLENGKLYQLTSTGGNAGEGQGKLIIGCNGKGNVMVMDPNLNVGIGTNNPVSKLDVMGEINVNSNKITNVADPVNNNDAANKAYVDALISQLSSKGVIVADADGNIYSTVRIGSQVWMAENLKTTKYSDGTAIPNVTDATAWVALTTPAYCWWANDAATYKTTYGALYNWYTVNTSKLCPIGWHVPTDAEWTTMENYLIANGYNYNGTTTFNYIAKSIAATSYWESAIESAAVGNTDYPTYRNKSGFTALPGGYRGYDGNFIGVGRYGYWRSSTEYDATHAYNRYLYYSWDSEYRSWDTKDRGFSVRCLRDN